MLCKWQLEHEHLQSLSYSFDIVYRSKLITKGMTYDQVVDLIGHAPDKTEEDSNVKRLIWSSTFKRGRLDKILSPQEQKGGIYLFIDLDSDNRVADSRLYEP